MLLPRSRSPLPAKSPTVIGAVAPAAGMPTSTTVPPRRTSVSAWLTAGGLPTVTKT